MAKDSTLTNVRYFFKWLAEQFRIWFTPYHVDDEDEEYGEEEEAAKPAAPQGKPGVTHVATSAAAAPSDKSDLSDKSDTGQSSYQYASPDASPTELVTGPADAAGVAEAPPGTFNQFEVVEAMAFRGAMTRKSLTDVLNATEDGVGLALDVLIQDRQIEDIGDGRYLIVDTERRKVLRNHPRVSEWLARLATPELQDRILDVIEQVCRHLQVKLLAGKSLVFHIRQKKWSVWQSHEGACIVRLSGTPHDEQWSGIRKIDKRARRFRRKEPHDWDVRDWVSFRWLKDTDAMAIEFELLDLGREFQKQVRLARVRPKETAPSPEE